MSQSIGLIAPVVKINGSELSIDQSERLQSVRISLALRIPGRAVLEFDDTGFTISAGGSIAMGNPVLVTASAGQKLFGGEITGINLDLEHGRPVLQVVADDLSYRMTLGTKVRTFTNVAYSDVVSQIAGDYGLSVDADSTEQTYEYLLQSDTDFGFLTEMADRVGYDWWVDADKKLHFKQLSESSTPTVLSWGEGLSYFSVRVSGLHPGSVEVRGWDPQQKSAVVGNSSSSAAGTDASLAQSFLAASSVSSLNQVVSTLDSPGTSSDATKLADREVTRWRSGSVLANGICTFMEPTMTPGGSVGISDAGTASGTYPLTEVEHVYDTRGFRTLFRVGDRQPSGLADTLAAPRPSSFRQHGLMIGIVTNNADPDSGGRVKVKLPALGDSVESQWARVVTVGGGNQRGITFLPEVNDEVIVGFEAGDTTRPVVIGGLYNGTDKGLDYGTANNAIQKRQIVSRLGHVIELGDGDGTADQHIDLTLAGGEHQIHLGKDKMVAKIPSGLPLTMQAGDSKIDIDASGAMTLQAQKVTIKADTDVEISGVNITLKASAKLAGSGAQVQMQGTGQAELSSSGQTAVKGSVVMIN